MKTNEIKTAWTSILGVALIALFAVLLAASLLAVKLDWVTVALALGLAVVWALPGEEKAREK